MPKIIDILKKFEILRVSILAIVFVSFSQIIDIYSYRYQLPFWTKILEEFFEMYFAFSLFAITMILKRNKNLNHS